MGKKIKIKDKNIYKLFESDKISSIKQTDYDGTRHQVTKEEIEKKREQLWDDIMNKKQAQLDDIYKQQSLNKAVFKISPAKMYQPITVNVKDLATGAVHEETIPAPSEIIAVAESIRDTAMNSPEYGILMKRFDKPIIWTLSNSVQTAASDGVRIAFNVVFTYQLLQLGIADKKAGSSVRNANAAKLLVGKYFLFVFIHEVYHELYRHQLQAERKKETAGGKMHDMANVAMDCEINRDIEQQFTGLRGSTDATGGCMDPDFPTETWDIIFDAYYYNHKQMPKHEKPQSGMPHSGQSQSGQDSSQQSQRSNIDEDPNSQQQTQGNGQSQNNSQGDNQQDQNSSGQQGQSGQQQSGQNSGQQQSGQQGQSGQNSGQPQPRGTGNESDEYNKAYNDELQKIADEMNGKKSSQEPVDLTPEEIEDIAQNIKDQLAAGMSMDDIIKANSSDAQDKNSTKLSEKSMRELQNALSDVMAEMAAEQQKEVQDGLANNGKESETQKAAKEQARKDVQKAMEQMDQQAEQEAESGNGQAEGQGAGKGTESMGELTTSSIFGGADMVSTEELSKLAEAEGQPYTADELTTDRNQANEDYIKDNLEKIKSTNAALGQKVENISNKLKDLTYLANWKNKLKKFLKNQTEGDPERVRSKKVMSQGWRDDRYVPYKNVTKKDEIGAADVFYLIDNSGSMWGAGFGEGIFLQIFKEIVGIERSCKIELSALTYFSGSNILPKEKIRLWDSKTSTSKVLQMIGQTKDDASGGTDIGGNVIAVTKLGKPYYYNTGQKHTLLIVFTDGEDPAQFKQIQSIPSRYKKDLLFCLINTKQSLVNLVEQYKKLGGVKLSNIIAIATDEYKNKK